MNEQELYEQMEQDIITLANKYSANRLQISTLNFDRDYRRADDGSFNLVATKAVIRVLGKTTKVPIGPDQTHQTYEQAFEATKLYWSEYYRKVRAKRSPAQKAAEARRQKAYREREKTAATKLKRQQ